MAGSHQYKDFHNDVKKVQWSGVTTGTIVAVYTNNDTADVNINGVGQVNGVPIFYHCPNSSTVVGGSVAFAVDDSVLILVEKDDKDATPTYTIIGFNNSDLHTCKPECYIYITIDHINYPISHRLYGVYDVIKDGWATDVNYDSGGVVAFPTEHSRYFYLDWWNSKTNVTGSSLFSLSDDSLCGFPLPLWSDYNEDTLHPHTPFLVGNHCGSLQSEESLSITRVKTCENGTFTDTGSLNCLWQINEDQYYHSGHNKCCIGVDGMGLVGCQDYATGTFHMSDVQYKDIVYNYANMWMYDIQNGTDMGRILNLNTGSTEKCFNYLNYQLRDYYRDYSKQSHRTWSLITDGCTYNLIFTADAYRVTDEGYTLNNHHIENAKYGWTEYTHLGDMSLPDIIGYEETVTFTISANRYPNAVYSYLVTDPQSVTGSKVESTYVGYPGGVGHSDEGHIGITEHGGFNGSNSRYFITTQKPTRTCVLQVFPFTRLYKKTITYPAELNTSTAGWRWGTPTIQYTRVRDIEIFASIDFPVKNDADDPAAVLASTPLSTNRSIGFENCVKEMLNSLIDTYGEDVTEVNFGVILLY